MASSHSKSLRKEKKNLGPLEVLIIVAPRAAQSGIPSRCPSSFLLPHQMSRCHHEPVGLIIKLQFMEKDLKDRSSLLRDEVEAPAKNVFEAPSLATAPKSNMQPKQKKNEDRSGSGSVPLGYSQLFSMALCSTSLGSSDLPWLATGPMACVAADSSPKNMSKMFITKTPGLLLGGWYIYG